MKTLQTRNGKGPSYVLPDDRVAAGASLGNSAVWVNIKATGAIERVFSTELGSCLIGSIVIHYAGAGGQVIRHADHSTSTATELGFVPLRAAEPGEFEIDPACQRHRFTLAGALSVTETVFVPLHALDPEHGDPPLLYQMVQMKNHAGAAGSVRITAFARLRGSTPPDVSASFDESIDALVAHNESNRDAVRVFGCTAPGARYA